MTRDDNTKPGCAGTFLQTLHVMGVWAGVVVTALGVLVAALALLVSLVQ